VNAYVDRLVRRVKSIDDDDDKDEPREMNETTRMMGDDAGKRRTRVVAVGRLADGQ